jgi:hypothetical protein
MNMSVKLLTGLAIAGLMATGAYAADLTVPETPQPMLPSAPNVTPFITISIGPGIDTVAPFGAGVITVGVNAPVSDPIIIGGEAQLGVDFTTGGAPFGIDFLVLGRLGAKVSDQVSIFAKAGLGYFTPIGAGVPGPTYAFGGELDFAATDNISITGEALAIGNIGAAPDAVRGQVGVMFHM